MYSTLLNEHFTNVAKNLATSLEDTMYNHMDFMDEENKSSIYLKLIEYFANCLKAQNAAAYASMLDSCFSACFTSIFAFLGVKRNEVLILRNLLRFSLVFFKFNFLLISLTATGPVFPFNACLSIPYSCSNS